MTTRRVSLCLWLLLAGAQFAMCMERLPSSFTAPVLTPESNDDHRFRQTESSEASLSSSGSASAIQSSFGSSSSGGSNNPWQNTFPIASSSSSAPPIPKQSKSASSSSASLSLAPKPPSAGTDTFALPARPHLGDTDGSSEEASSLASATVEGQSQSLEAVRGPSEFRRSNNPKSVDDPLTREESSSSSAQTSTVSSGFSRSSSIARPLSTQTGPVASSSGSASFGNDAPPRPNNYNPLFSIESPAAPRPNVLVSGENTNQLGPDKDLPLREEALPEAQNCPNIAAEVELAASDRRARQAQIAARDQDLTQLSLRVELAQEKVTAIHKDMAAFIRKNRPQADDLELKHFRERYDDAKMEVAKAKLKRDDFFAATDAEDGQILREKFTELPRILDTLAPLEARMVQERARWQKESGKLTQDAYQAQYTQLKQLACSIFVMRTKAKALSNLEGEFKQAVDKRNYEKSESERRHRQWAEMHSRVTRQQKVTRLHQLDQILDELKSVVQDKENRFRRDSRSGVLRLKSSVRNAIQEIVNLKKQRAAAEEERQAVKRDLAAMDTPTPEPVNPESLPSKVAFAMSSQRKSSSSLASQTLERLESQTIQMLSATSAP